MSLIDFMFKRGRIVVMQIIENHEINYHWNKLRMEDGQFWRPSNKTDDKKVRKRSQPRQKFKFESCRMRNSDMMHFSMNKKQKSVSQQSKNKIPKVFQILKQKDLSYNKLVAHKSKLQIQKIKFLQKHKIIPLKENQETNKIKGKCPKNSTYIRNQKTIANARKQVRPKFNFTQFQPYQDQYLIKKSAKGFVRCRTQSEQNPFTLSITGKQPQWPLFQSFNHRF